MIDYPTDAIRTLRSPAYIDHAVVALQIPLSLLHAIGESTSVEAVRTSMAPTVERVLQVCLADFPSPLRTRRWLTLPGVSQYATDASSNVQLMPHITQTICGCIIVIVVGLASWCFTAARARRVAEASPSSSPSTPLGRPLSQGSSSELSGHGASSDGLPRPYAEVLGSEQFLHPTSSGARLRHSVNLPLNSEAWRQELEEVERRVLKAQARQKSPHISRVE